MYSLSSRFIGGIALLSVVTASSANTISLRQSPSTCGVGNAPAIVQPSNGVNITSPTFQIVYCSGAYDKTRTIDASVWLTSPGSESGQLLVKDMTTNDGDTYTFNATITPADGLYDNGDFVLSVYETTTGMFRYVEKGREYVLRLLKATTTRRTTTSPQST